MTTSKKTGCGNPAKSEEEVFCWSFAETWSLQTGVCSLCVLIFKDISRLAVEGLADGL